MPILPIDTGRYVTPEMEKIFDEEARLQKLLDVEAALAWALAKVGICPVKDAEKIVKKASTKYVKLNRVEEIEKATRHDIMAMVNALAEACGEAGSYIHYGATSSDILDTATALQFKEALTVIEEKLNRLEARLMKFAGRYKRTIMIGRTHGQHALPITFGLKTAVWMREVSRHIQRLIECKERVLVGKITGAVGTQAGLGSKGIEIQRLTMKKLSLKPAEVSTQN
jgi:adenylosuccinate lyase